MTWDRFAVARQLIAEERLGSGVREVARAEDDAFARASRNLQRMNA